MKAMQVQILNKSWNSKLFVRRQQNIWTNFDSPFAQFPFPLPFPFDRKNNRISVFALHYRYLRGLRSAQYLRNADAYLLPHCRVILSLQHFDTRRLKQIELRDSFPLLVTVPVPVSVPFPFAGALSNPLALLDRYLLRSRAHFKYLGCCW